MTGDGTHSGIEPSDSEDCQSKDEAAVLGVQADDETPETPETTQVEEESVPSEIEPASTGPVVLKGTGKGLEIVVDEAASADDIGEALAAWLDKSPSFFAGNDVTVRVRGRLPSGALARLEEVTEAYELSIAEVTSIRPDEDDEDISSPEEIPLAEGSGDVASEAAQDSEDADDDDSSAHESEAAQMRAEGGTNIGDAPTQAEGEDQDAGVEEPGQAEDELDPDPPPSLVVGPVRSGIVMHAPGHLIVLGDVNPGAEVRAEGNIMVLGRLRGVAHAAPRTDTGFIMALRLEPQQLRIGTLVARAGDSDSPSQGAEIAYVTDRTIVVERYVGRLPSGLQAAV